MSSDNGVGIQKMLASQRIVVSGFLYTAGIFGFHIMIYMTLFQDTKGQYNILAMP
jgi:hypothetical protein